MNKRLINAYTGLLKEELVPALGCTEPIAIAYAAAKARDALGCMPDHIKATCSGNIIKNVKSVVVPNSDGQRGIKAAAALGVAGGDASKEFEVLSTVKPSDIELSKKLISEGFCDEGFERGKDNLYIRIDASKGSHTSAVVVEKYHTNVTLIEIDGKAVYINAPQSDESDSDAVKMTVKDIIDYANEVNLDDIRGILVRQLELNDAISDEGLSGDYGVGVGKMLMTGRGDSIDGRAAARAAAGSDARMNGCGMPVVINSGSGNQGLTVTLPVEEYAASWNVPEDKKLRALALSNLISIHVKSHIGNLSAFCGAVSAACGSAAAIAYMDGCDYDRISMTITNTLCNVGGMVCDGAKSSCAAKIASAVDAGTMAYRMAKSGRSFPVGDGLVGTDIEKTIENIGRMGREGMRTTDEKILGIMVGEE